MWPEALREQAEQLGARREPHVRATVVRAQRPTSAHAGDTALVLRDGVIHGFVGGNCVEASVRRYGLEALATGLPLLLRVAPGEPGAVREEGAVQVANPCLSGGTVEIFLEPWLPAPRVLVIGATPIARALALLGTGLGLDMVLTDGSEAVPRADDAAVIVASHGFDEEPALEAALRAGVPYVALVASATRGAAVLASLDVDEQQRSRVHSPAGLDLGARTPPEIALSILAQLVAERAAGRAVPEPEPADHAALDHTAHDHAAPDHTAHDHAALDHTAHTASASEPPGEDTAASAAHPHPAPAVPTAVDPICGMVVAAVDATLHVDHDGTRSYFCSSGCRTTFLAHRQHDAVAG